MLTPAEKVEVALIPLIALAMLLVAPPPLLEVGKLLLACSGLFLLQGLCRDLWLLVRARRDRNRQEPVAAQCLCLESAVGVLGVLSGISLLGSGFTWSIALGKWGPSLAALAVLTSGFLTKDFVIEWNPWRFRREKDHQNIIVKWRK